MKRKKLELTNARAIDRVDFPLLHKVLDMMILETRERIFGRPLLGNVPKDCPSFSRRDHLWTDRSEISRVSDTFLRVKPAFSIPMALLRSSIPWSLTSITRKVHKNVKTLKNNSKSENKK